MMQCTKRLRLASLERQPERPVSLEQQRQAQAEPELVRERLERQLSVPGCPRTYSFYSLSLPSPDYFSDFGEGDGEGAVFFIVEGFYLPGDS